MFGKFPDLIMYYGDKVSEIENEFDQAIYELSVQENNELLNNIFNNINGAISGSSNFNALSFKRDIHTLKGGLRMYGHNMAGAVAHRIESLIDYVESEEIPWEDYQDFLKIECDRLSFLLKKREEFSLVEKKWLDNETDTLGNIVDSVEDVNLNEMRNIKVSSAVLDSLIDEASDLRLTIASLKEFSGSSSRSTKELRSSAYKALKIIKEIELKAETQINAKNNNEEDNVTFDPLEFDRFTRLQELTRFMHEAIEDIVGGVKSIEQSNFNIDKVTAKQSLLTDNILNHLMSVRLVSVSSISDKLYKIVRVASKSMKKNAKLNIYGEKHEVDRVVLERVQHPIEHILRNCIAHGLESQEDRLMNNKSAIGKIDVNISIDGNFIVFEISDDGAGIDIDKIKRKAIEKGFISPELNYEDREIIDLIFKPRFTTADKLSQDAGRGIGMEVVKNEVLSLGGSVVVNSALGKGTKFTIAVPLSVATNQSMLTMIDGKVFAIPAILIEEVISIGELEIKKGYKNGYLSHRGEKLALHYLGEITGASENRKIGKYNKVLFLNYIGHKIMLHIDNFRSIEEVVVKSAGGVIGKVNGVLGLTVLGDGNQGIVINPILLVEHYKKYVLGENRGIVEEKNNTNKLIMVVDDSATIRVATSKFLERSGFEVVVAKDGQEALDLLLKVDPIIILSDVEMPIMNGFDFLKQVKSKSEYSNIPVIMITSRTASKHKEFAFSLGASEYLGKPYQEDELLNIISKLTLN